MIKYFADFILHIDKNLVAIVSQYGAWTYAILFAIVFMETGLVVTPFLPGDSLLFAAGAIAAQGALNIWVTFGLLFAAAVIGDSVNYFIGKSIGPKAFEGDHRLLKREYLEKAQSFYEKHGGKAIVLARFVPIVRTFAPFVAGVGTMDYGKFITYNVLGGFIWVFLFTFGGYFFGSLPIIRDNFHTVVIAIVLISVVPVVLEIMKARREK
ncbi:MAG: DedA family protein [Patescibacteria group bacterium]